ncbi:tail fiber protein [Bradyrhizobium sp. STM 3809]|uniref:phage tail protein n=1 Tax=Bradyrhizobium sp. STM 3809 TaxID=551936 RepID=UPI0002407BAC|nr:tail fiber protein [Bradyrhizobium sp. STM 3809]CCD97794.1 Phenylacrylic acid decarboxylase [Bradyrhizobium sp. STM 3809]
MPMTPVLGQIMPFAGSQPPRGWAFCNGALLAIQTNQALFSLLGTYYGGNGVTTFALPDLRGRAILGSTGSSGQYPAGMVSGETAVTLTEPQLPAHNHLMQASTTSGTGRVATPTDNLFGTNTFPPTGTKQIFATAGVGEVPLALGTNITNTGGGQAHNNMQPYLVINYLIAMQGVYPSRD